MAHGVRRRPATVGLIGLVLAAALGLTPVRAAAVTVTWTGGGSSPNWSDPANWQNGVVPVTGADVVFPQLPQPVIVTTVDDLPGVAPNRLLFEYWGYSVSAGTGVTSLTLTGASPVTVGPAPVPSGAADFELPVTFTQPTATITVGADNSVRFDQPITAGAIDFEGAGFMMLGAANAYAGGTTIDHNGVAEGRVIAEVPGAFGSGPVEVGWDAEVGLDAHSGTVWANNFVLDGGIIATQCGYGGSPCPQTVSGTVTSNVQGAIRLGYAYGSGTDSAHADLTLTGGLAGNGAMDLEETWSGYPELLTIRGSTNSTNSGTLTIDTTVDLDNAAGTLASSATSYVVNSPFTLSNAGQIPASSTVEVSRSGTFTPNGQSVDTLAMRGGLVHGPMTVTGKVTSSGGGEIDGLVLPNAGEQVEDDDQGSWYGVEINGITAPQGWTVTGDGVVTLLGGDSQGPITVQHGYLGLLPCGGCGQVDVPVSVETGGGLRGSGGGMPSVTVSGGTLLPTGTLSLGSLSLDGASVFEDCDFCGGGEGTVVATGPVNLGSASLDMNVDPSPGERWTLISNHSGEPVTGAFAGLPQHAVFSPSLDGRYAYTIDYDANPEGDVVVTYAERPGINVSPATSAPIVYTPGQPVNFTVTVQGDPKSCCPTPTGSITVFDGYAPLQTVQLQTGNGSSQATASVTFTTWPHSVWFLYNGDDAYLPSASWATSLVPSDMPAGPVGHAGSPSGPGVTTGPPAPASTASGTPAVVAHPATAPGGSTPRHTGENADVMSLTDPRTVPVPEAGTGGREPSGPVLVLAGLVLVALGCTPRARRRRRA